MTNGAQLNGPGDPGSNSGWFTVSNSNRKLRFHESYKHVVLSIKYSNLAMGGILVGINKYKLKL